MLNKIISGGQTGVDVAGLRIAKLKGIETGGYAPKGWRTQSGDCPELGTVFGLVEHPLSRYDARTGSNVKEADGTIRFASNWNSAGERCTLNAINRHNKPHIDVDINNPISAEEVLRWLVDNKIRVLNVAGNSERTSPGIEKFVFSFLCNVINLVKGME
jgi:hypothetical protein